MSLGERIRQARLAEGLSQRQLCGEEITRNMLSQIENGSAMPSMGTLQFLARRLGKPAAFFLEEDSAVSTNGTCMDAAWRLLEAGHPATALEQLEHYKSPDPVYDREYGILLQILLLTLAEKNIAVEKTYYARQLLERAEQYEKPWLPELRNRRLLLAARLGDYAADQSMPEIDEILLLRASAALKAGDTASAAAILGAADNKSAPNWCMVRGKVAMADGDYPTAAKHLQSAEKAYPVQTIPLLEQCFREMGDFKSAYYYACKARERE